jgi:flagellar hook-basal body complex protein FliE
MVSPVNAGNVESLLSQIRQYQAQAAQGVDILSTQRIDSQSATGGGFADAVKGALNEVNSAQMLSKASRTAYERGEDMPLTDVVMNMQKSSLAFEATLQIRNKVLKAYEDIMNMPV